MTQEFTTFLLAMLPISELRGALPTSLILFKMTDFEALFWSILGNILVIPFVFFLLSLLQSKIISRISFLKSFSEKFLAFLKKRANSKNIENLVGLTLFVAVPFPLTGAWTGTIISYFLGIPFKLAFLSISVGVLLSAILVFSLTKTGILIEKSFGLSGLFLFLLALSLFLVFSQKNKKSYEK
jgi:uncharacterized membrane protein